MFFAKDEIIELEDQNNYLVLDTAIVDNEVFYQIQEINSAGNNLVGFKTIITAINNEGNLYIEDVEDANKLNQLQEIFTS